MSQTHLVHTQGIMGKKSEYPRGLFTSFTAEREVSKQRILARWMSPQEDRQSIIWSRSQLSLSSPMVWVNVLIIGMDFFKKKIAKDVFLWQVALSREPGLLSQGASRGSPLCICKFPDTLSVKSTLYQSRCTKKVGESISWIPSWY